jgi:hypothetical protein
MMQWNSQKGFVILFAIIISTMVLLVGAGIFSVAFKETVLASTANESHISLFAADMGMECALYHEFVCIRGEAGYCSAPDTIMCDFEDIDMDVPASLGPGTSSVTGLFSYEVRYDVTNAPSCGEITVLRDQTQPDDPSPTPIEGTQIFARGYNKCARQSNRQFPIITDPLLTERRLEAWYPNPAAGP